ncbi:MAG: hypothetical protein WDZ85_01180 [Candidatus Paceibacterota bacterium]
MKTKKALHLMSKIIKSPRAFYIFIAHCCKQYRYNDLIQFANEELTDKGIPGHGYVRVYDAFLRSRREENLCICEVGLVKKKLRKSSVDDEHALAPSLEMWMKYLPNAQVVGFDIRKFKTQYSPRCVTVQGDQSRRADLQKILDYHTHYDVIIDDASHVSAHQQITFSYLFPHLNSGGLYVIEDLKSQPSELESSSVPKTLSLLRDLSVNGVWSSPVANDAEKDAVIKQVDKVYFFESIGSADSREGEGALAVVIKK